MRNVLDQSYENDQNLGIRYVQRTPLKMPQLSTYRLNEVKEILQESFFTLAGYKIHFFESDANKILRIDLRDTDHYIELSYKIKPRAQLGAEEMDAAGQVVRYLIMTERPGDFIQVLTRSVSSFTEFNESLRNWTLRVQHESLLGSSLEANLEKFQNELNEKIDAHFKDGSAHFSENEKAEFRERLEELERKFSEFEAMKNGSAQKEVHRSVEELNAGLETMSKRRWMRTTMSTIGSLVFKFLNSESGLKILEDVDRHLLK